MYKIVEAYEEPLSLNQEWKGKLYGSEMSTEQQKFLCGLIKEKKPKKILELGVAAGGTSCLIQYTLQLLGQRAEMYSVDLATKFWQDNRKSSGFLLEEMKGKFSLVEHYLFTGGTFPEFVDKIGEGIDFLVLDTAHWLPGELLEFLVCLPYLTKDATVVVHDVMLNQFGGDDPHTYAYASKLLYATVTAEKYLCFGTDKTKQIYPLENIGAFSLNPETFQHIEDCFYALTFNWRYEMSDEVERKYRAILSSHYSSQCMKLYEAAKAVNHKSLIYARLRKNYHSQMEFEQVLQKWRQPENRCVLLYGCGAMGQLFLQYGTICNLRVDGFVVSDGQCIHDIRGCNLPVWHLKNLPWTNEECMFVLTPANPMVREECRRILHFEGYDKVL